MTIKNVSGFIPELPTQTDQGINREGDEVFHELPGTELIRKFTRLENGNNEECFQIRVVQGEFRGKIFNKCTITSSPNHVTNISYQARCIGNNTSLHFLFQHGCWETATKVFQSALNLSILSSENDLGKTPLGYIERQLKANPIEGKKILRKFIDTMTYDLLDFDYVKKVDRKDQRDQYPHFMSAIDEYLDETCYEFSKGNRTNYQLRKLSRLLILGCGYRQILIHNVFGGSRKESKFQEIELKEFVRSIIHAGYGQDMLQQACWCGGEVREFFYSLVMEGVDPSVKYNNGKNTFDFLKDGGALFDEDGVEPFQALIFYLFKTEQYSKIQEVAKKSPYLFKSSVELLSGSPIDGDFGTDHTNFYMYLVNNRMAPFFNENDELQKSNIADVLSSALQIYKLSTGNFNYTTNHLKFICQLLDSFTEAEQKETADLCMEKDVYLSGENEAQPGIHWLARYGQIQVVNEFVKRGADLNVKNSKDETIFRYCLRYSNFPLFSMDFLQQFGFTKWSLLTSESRLTHRNGMVLCRHLSTLDHEQMGKFLGIKTQGSNQMNESVGEINSSLQELMKFINLTNSCNTRSLNVIIDRTAVIVSQLKLWSLYQSKVNNNNQARDLSCDFDDLSKNLTHYFIDHFTDYEHQFKPQIDFVLEWATCDHSNGTIFCEKIVRSKDMCAIVEFLCQNKNPNTVALLHRLYTLFQENFTSRVFSLPTNELQVMLNLVWDAKVNDSDYNKMLDRSTHFNLSFLARRGLAYCQDAMLKETNKTQFKIDAVHGNALHFALLDFQHHKSLDVIKYFIENGCDIAHKNKSGNTPFQQVSSDFPWRELSKELGFRMLSINNSGELKNLLRPRTNLFDGNPLLIPFLKQDRAMLGDYVTTIMKADPKRLVSFVHNLYDMFPNQVNARDMLNEVLYLLVFDTTHLSESRALFQVPEIPKAQDPNLSRIDTFFDKIFFINTKRGDKAPEGRKDYFDIGKCLEIPSSVVENYTKEKLLVSINKMLTNISENRGIIATPSDPELRRTFYHDIKKCLYHTIEALLKIPEDKLWQYAGVLVSLAEAGNWCGVRQLEAAEQSYHLVVMKKPHSFKNKLYKILLDDRRQKLDGIIESIDGSVHLHNGLLHSHGEQLGLPGGQPDRHANTDMFPQIITEFRQRYSMYDIVVLLLSDNGLKELCEKDELIEVFLSITPPTWKKDDYDSIKIELSEFDDFDDKKTYLFNEHAIDITGKAESEIVTVLDRHRRLSYLSERVYGNDPDELFDSKNEVTRDGVIDLLVSFKVLNAALIK